MSEIFNLSPWSLSNSVTNVLFALSSQRTEELRGMYDKIYGTTYGSEENRKAQKDLEQALKVFQEDWDMHEQEVGIMDEIFRVDAYLRMKQENFLDN